MTTTMQKSITAVACVILSVQAGIAPTGTCSGGCNWDQFCDATTKVCKQRLDRGATCDVVGMCVPGLGCHGSKCETLRLKGESCASVPCKSGPCDTLNTGAGLNTCKDWRSFAVGLKCGGQNWCKTDTNAVGGYCDEGKCKAKGKLGSNCSLGIKQCQTASSAGTGASLGVICPNAICATKKDLGDACTKDSECGRKSGQMYCIHQKCALKSGEGGKCGFTPANTDVRQHCKVPLDAQAYCKALKCVVVKNTASTPATVCGSSQIGGKCTAENCECNAVTGATFYGNSQGNGKSGKYSNVFCKGLPPIEKGGFHVTYSSWPPLQDGQSQTGTCSMPLAIGERGCRRMGDYDWPRTVHPKDDEWTTVPNVNERCAQPAVCLDENPVPGFTNAAGLCVKVKSHGEACEAPPGYSSAADYANDQGYHEQCNKGYCQDGVCTLARTLGSQCDDSYQCGFDSRAWVAHGGKSPDGRSAVNDLWDSGTLLCAKGNQENGPSNWLNGPSWGPNGTGLESFCVNVCGRSKYTTAQDKCPTGTFCDSSGSSRTNVLKGHMPGLYYDVAPVACVPSNSMKLGEACATGEREQNKCAQSPKKAVCIPGEWNWDGRFEEDATQGEPGGKCRYGNVKGGSLKYPDSSLFHTMCLTGAKCVKSSAYCCPYQKRGYTEWENKVYDAGPNAADKHYATDQKGKCNNNLDFNQTCCPALYQSHTQRCFLGTCPNVTREVWVSKWPKSWNTPKHRCISRKQAGEACEGFNATGAAQWHTQCPGGHCNAEGKCTGQTTCMKDWECGHNRVCNGATATTSGKCVTECKFAADCEDDTMFCESKSCIPRFKLGATCTKKDSCTKNAICEGLTCKVRPNPVSGAFPASTLNGFLKITAAFLCMAWFA